MAAIRFYDVRIEAMREATQADWDLLWSRAWANADKAKARAMQHTSWSDAFAIVGAAACFAAVLIVVIWRGDR